MVAKSTRPALLRAVLMPGVQPGSDMRKEGNIIFSEGKDMGGIGAMSTNVIMVSLSLPALKPLNHHSFDVEIPTAFLCNSFSIKLLLGKAQSEVPSSSVGLPDSKRRLHNVSFSDQHHNTCDKDHPYSYNKGSHCCETKASSLKNAFKMHQKPLLSLSFLSDPKPINIACPCPSLLLTCSLTQSASFCET